MPALVLTGTSLQDTTAADRATPFPDSTVSAAPLGSKAQVPNMPRRWAQQCRNDPDHSGPFSRMGLCPSCRASLLSEAGKKGANNDGGRPRGSTYKKPYSRLPLARRVRHAIAKSKKKHDIKTRRPEGQKFLTSHLLPLPTTTGLLPREGMHPNDVDSRTKRTAKVPPRVRRG